MSLSSKLADPVIKDYNAWEVSETMWLDQVDAFTTEDEEAFQLRIDLIGGKPRYLVVAAIVESDGATCDKEHYKEREVSPEVWRDLATLQSINETRRLRINLHEALNSVGKNAIRVSLATIANK